MTLCDVQYTMAKRLTDTEIWDEDWFIDLPNDYKLFFLYIKDRCDHGGFYRPNRRKFSHVIGGKLLMYDDFLKHVNVPDEGKTQPKRRIIVLESGKWFIPKFFGFQQGNYFNIKNGAHRGALKLIVSNGIHPKDVPDMVWNGMDEYDSETLRNLVHGKGLYALSQEQGSRHSTSNSTSNGTIKGKGVVGEKPIFKLQSLYDLEWNQVDTRERDFKGITEPQFAYWKKFVDWVIGKGYDELFKAIFVTPADFNTLVNRNGFTEDKWEPVVKKLLSTGIKPEQNLYFRIPDFMKHAKVLEKSSTSSMSAGAPDYENMEKW